MRIIKNLVLLAVTLAFSAPLISISVNAQAVKIGFVKDEQIKIELKAWQQADELWKIESNAWEEEALSKQVELQELIDEYEKQKLILSDVKRREREAAIRAKQEALDSYTRQVFGPNGTAERKHAELLEPLLNRITKAIEAVAIEGDYDVVFTLQSGLGYIKESHDITNKILRYLEDHDE